MLLKRQICQRLYKKNVKRKDNILYTRIDLDFLTTKLVKGHCTPLPRGSLLVKSEPDWARGEKTWS